MKPLLFIIALTVSAASTLFSCGAKSDGKLTSGDTLTTESRLLTIVDHGDYMIADIRNPWTDSLPLLERYVLAPKDYKGPLPDGTVVRTPIERSVVFSSVHGGAIDELGTPNAIKGVADGQYFINPAIVSRIKAGKIADIGNSMSPSTEKIVDLDPDAILLSPFQNKESGAVTKLGIPVLQCVDYLESTPLGRAEWIRLLGALYGRPDVADSIFSAVKREYVGLRDSLALLSYAPVVLTEQPMPSGEWDVPAGESYMARILTDAAAIYPWAGTKGTGSLKLDAPAVLDKAENADYWLIRSFGPLSFGSLMAGNPLSSHFKTAATGNIYVCDTSVSPIFDEFPFHPERLLRDYAAIFHPDLFPGYRLRYFQRIGK